MEDAPGELDSRGAFAGVIRKGLLVFVLILAVLAVLAWLAGDVSLPNQYEGFD